jgi:transposase-like protein
MRGIKVVEREDVLKDHQRVFRKLEERVKGLVVDMLSDVRVHLSRELRGLGLEVMQAVMELEITEVAGAKGKHLVERRYSRWGRNPGWVSIDGIKERTEVPRVVEPGTGRSYGLKTYGLFQQTGEVVKRAYRDLIRGISTRRFSQGVEGFIRGHGISASTISRRMVTATAAKVQELFSRPLVDFELAVLMLDGVEIGGHAVVIALGIDVKGVKRVLGLRQGATENTAVTKGLLEDLVERGLSTQRPILVVIDGAKALRKAVMDVFGEQTQVQRCTVHKRRNVLEHLPKKERTWVSIRLTQAYRQSDHQKALGMLKRLSQELRTINPDAQRSLEEGMEETLTVQRLGLPEQLRKSLQSTNLIESTNGAVRDRSRNVKRWHNGKQIERWVAAGLLETEQKFRSIKGCNHMSMLVTALNNRSVRQQSAA